MTEGGEEIAQLVLAQRAILNGNGYDGLALIQEGIGAGNSLGGMEVEEYVSYTRWKVEE